MTCTTSTYPCMHTLTCVATAYTSKRCDDTYNYPDITAVPLKERCELADDLCRSVKCAARAGAPFTVGSVDDSVGLLFLTMLTLATQLNEVDPALPLSSLLARLDDTCRHREVQFSDRQLGTLALVLDLVRGLTLAN